ncbi:MAG: serine/threonine protein kinase, partial [Myxococcales bacterium]|nr:serine/threonine protein kinase [Myxococcales bacterium]
PLIGKVIRGNYRVMKRIGSGAMGAIYTAEQISLSRIVAVKVLHRHLLTDENLLKRFQREAHAAALLKHPNTIDILEFGQAEDGSLYIAMEFVSGRDLADTLDRDGPLEFPRIVRILKQVCLALDQAHEKGIIHRDLKPENIMLEPRKTEPDFVKVLDFGIAKIQDPERKGDRWQTMAGLVCGTPEYMAPEQARGEVLDARCDLYALGIIIYQLVTQTLPFTGDSPISIVTRHLTDPVEPPSKLRPDVPTALEALCLRLVAKNRDERPRSAMEVYDELTAIEATFGSNAAPRLRSAVGPVVAPTPSPNDSATVLFNLDAHRPIGGRRSTPAASVPAQQRPQWLWPAVALVVALLAVVAILLLNRTDDAEAKNVGAAVARPVSPPTAEATGSPSTPLAAADVLPVAAALPPNPAPEPIKTTAVVPTLVPVPPAPEDLERREDEPTAARLERRPPALSAPVAEVVAGGEKKPKQPTERPRPEKVPPETNPPGTDPPEKDPPETPSAEEAAAKAAAKAAAASEASDRAMKAESAGQYAVAARAWAEAYALKPQTNLLKKIGFAQAKAGDTSQACKSFQRYVKSLPAEKRASAASALAAYECGLTL